jgi:hypothetical protein
MDCQKKVWCQNIKARHKVEIEILKPNQAKILWSKTNAWYDVFKVLKQHIKQSWRLKYLKCLGQNPKNEFKNAWDENIVLKWIR